MKQFRRAMLTGLVLAVAPTARAEVELRVEPWPNTAPIEAHVRVSDANGAVAGLASGDFTVRLDGTPINISGFGLPPDQDPAQRTSIILAFRTIDSGTYGVPAMIDFVNHRAVGDYVGAIRFQSRQGTDLFRTQQDLTYLDGNTATDSVTDFIGRFRIDPFLETLQALELATQQFALPPVALPSGPKAIILIDGRPAPFFGSQSELITQANAIGLPIFTIQRGVSNPGSWGTALMQGVARNTGGTYVAAADEAQVAHGLTVIASSLEESYRLVIPQSAVTDCNLHMLEVTVRGEAASLAFTRCDSTPERVSFDFQSGVAPDVTVVSNALTLTGFESPVEVRVIDGEYSVGCGNSFISAPSILAPGNPVCVRHRSSPLFATMTSTILIAGDVPVWFTSETRVENVTTGGGGGGSSGSGGGGGGSSGLIDALLLLAAVFAQRRRIASAA